MRRDNWWRMPAAAWMIGSRGICSRQAFPSRRWSLISIVRCGNRRGGLWWWKDSWAASECIQLAIATWVALRGVNLSEMQEKLRLERFPRLVLLLDGDEA